MFNLSDEEEAFENVFKKIVEGGNNYFEKQYTKCQNMNDTLNYWIQGIEKAGFKVEKYTIKEK